MNHHAQTRPPAAHPTAQRLYERYGAKPWSELPEPTREHYRKLVAAGIDGRGRPLRDGDTTADY